MGAPHIHNYHAEPQKACRMALQQNDSLPQHIASTPKVILDRLAFIWSALQLRWVHLWINSGFGIWSWKSGTASLVYVTGNSTWFWSYLSELALSLLWHLCIFNHACWASKEQTLSQRHWDLRTNHYFDIPMHCSHYKKYISARSSSIFPLFYYHWQDALLHNGRIR